MPHQHKAGGKTDQKGYDKSRNMWLERNKPEMEHLFVQYKIIGQEKNKNVEQCVGAAAGCVAKGLQRDELSEGRVEKIYYGNDLLFWHNPQSRAAKLI